MALVFGQACYLGSRKVLVIGTVVLLICVVAALMIAFEEYFTVGEFFSLNDIRHHEAVEVTILAFGIGVFVAATGFTLHHSSQTAPLYQYQYPFPGYYQYPYQSMPPQPIPPQWRERR